MLGKHRINGPQGSLEDAIPQRLVRALRRICTREDSGLAAVRVPYLRAGAAFTSRHSAEVTAPLPPAAQQPPPADPRTVEANASATAKTLQATAQAAAQLPNSVSAAARSSSEKGSGARKLSLSLSRNGFEAALSRITSSDRMDQLQASPSAASGYSGRQANSRRQFQVYCHHPEVD